MKLTYYPPQCEETKISIGTGILEGSAPKKDGIERATSVLFFEDDDFWY